MGPNSSSGKKKENTLLETIKFAKNGGENPISNVALKDPCACRKNSMKKELGPEEPCQEEKLTTRRRSLPSPEKKRRKTQLERGKGCPTQENRAGCLNEKKKDLTNRRKH